jgi:hypothetical protein
MDGRLLPHAGAFRKNAPVSILQFIVDMKWAFFALILTIGVGIWVKRSSKETKHALRLAIVSRGVKVGLPGGFNLDWAAPPPSTDVLNAATVPDEKLAEASEAAGEPDATPEQVQELRRLAVEQLVRESVSWGYSMARLGQRPPAPQIDWVDGQPRIANESRLEAALAAFASDRSAGSSESDANRAAWFTLSRHLNSQLKRDLEGGDPTAGLGHKE